MIFIYSSLVDGTTAEVCDYFDRKGIEYIIIDDKIQYLEHNLLDVLEPLGSEVYYNIKNLAIKVCDIKCIWLRKFTPIIEFQSESNKFKSFIPEIYIEETNPIKEYIGLINKEQTYTLGTSQDINKLYVLNVANRMGIKVPKSYLVKGEIENVIMLLKKHNKIITKAINNFYILTNELNKKRIMGHCSVVNMNTIETFVKETGQKTIHFPSLIQEYIEKKSEIRCVYLFGEFFCATYFTQEMEETKDDSRNFYNENQPFYYPFVLPDEIKVKINNLMVFLSLEFGVIDLILTPEFDIYFLEVNPWGEFTEMDVICNFGIAERIAKKLITESWKRN